MWKTVLFDLDGTLTDSAEGITKSVQYALEKLGLEVPELSELNCFVGPPLHDMFMKYADLDAETADKGVALYRERYVQTGMFENHLYPWIVKLLDLLRKNGIKMGVASSKPEVYVKQILEYFNIAHFFKVIVGSELNGERVHKKDVLEEAIRRLHMENKKDQIVLVGDTEFDIRGAYEVGIACIAVSYGYGDREKLEESNPIYIADSVSDIAECILSRQPKVKKESLPLQIWRIIYPILIHLGLSVLISSGWSLVYTIYEMTVNKNFDVDLITTKLLSHNNSMLICISIISILIFSMLFRRDEWYRKELGLRSRLMAEDSFGIPRMILVGVFFILYSTFLNQMIAWSGIASLFTVYDQVAQSLFVKESMVISYISLGILAPIAEEFVFRGLVYRRIRDYVNVKWAIIITSLLFGLYHGNMVQFIFATLLGVALAAVYERYKTLWAPILAHMAVNGFACIMEFSGVEILPDSTFGLMIMVFFEVILIAVLGAYMLRKWRPHKKMAEADTQGNEEAEMPNGSILTEQE